LASQLAWIEDGVANSRSSPVGPKQAVESLRRFKLGVDNRRVTFYLLFVVEFKTRRVHFAGCTTNPHDTWMKQMARELTNHEDGFLQGKRYLIMDRDTKFSDSFRTFLSKEGVESVRLYELRRLFCEDAMVEFILESSDYSK